MSSYASQDVLHSSKPNPICPRCLIREKALSPTNKKRTSKWRAYCAPCEAEKTRLWRAANKVDPVTVSALAGGFAGTAEASDVVRDETPIYTSLWKRMFGRDG